jgi:hypothetical protein
MPKMSRRERNGYLVYGGWIAAWGVLEYLGFKSWTPWPPLSDTTWYLQRRGKLGAVAALGLYGGLGILQKHVADHWPDKTVSGGWHIDPHGTLPVRRDTDEVS